jgi:hypothetical protein
MGVMGDLLPIDWCIVKRGTFEERLNKQNAIRAKTAAELAGIHNGRNRISLRQKTSIQITQIIPHFLAIIANMKHAQNMI